MNRSIRTVGFAVGLLLMAGAAFGQIGISTGVEPALNAPARFAASASLTAQATENGLISIKADSARTLTGGYTRTLVEFYPGIALYMDALGGVARYE